MAVFTRTWNATYEGQPADTENVSLGALRIRNLKTDVNERMAIDHEWSNTTHDGKHKKISLREQNPAPTRETGDGVVYMDNASPKQLHYVNSGGVDTVLPFPTGTKMLFYQASAPTGWTIDAAIHDRVVRVVDGSTIAGGASGGDASWGAGSPVTVSGHALTTDELPPHTHEYRRIGNAGSGNGVWFSSGSPGAANVTNDANTSDGGFAGDTHSHGTAGAASWRPPTYDFIVCTKD